MSDLIKRNDDRGSRVRGHRTRGEDGERPRNELGAEVAE